LIFQDRKIFLCAANIIKGEGNLNYKVVYFSRSNTSKRIAEGISKKLNCSIVQVTDDKNWDGLFGFIKAGFYSSTNKRSR